MQININPKLYLNIGPMSFKKVALLITKSISKSWKPARKSSALETLFWLTIRIKKLSKSKWVSLTIPTSPTRISSFKWREMEINVKKFMSMSSDLKNRRMILLYLWTFSIRKVLQPLSSSVLKTLKEHTKIHYFSISMKEIPLTQKMEEKMMRRMTLMMKRTMKKINSQLRRKRKMMRRWRNLNAINNDLFIKYLIN